MGINIEPVGATTTLGEGPHWDNKAKVLYYVDITNSTVNKYDPATKKLNTVKIVYRRHRNVAYSLVPKMEAELDRLEEEGILSKVTHADYATPVVPVMKSDGTIRICGDFKTTINPQLIIEDYPIPNIEVVVLFLAIIIFGMSGAQQTVTVDPRAVQETVKGNIDFTFSLYKILAKAKSGNIIVSPMSLEVVLAMAYFGARGETAEQIATGISLPAEQNLALDGFRHLLSSFKSTSNLTLEIANKVFTQQNYVIKEDFQALVKKSFLSEAQALNFADNVVSAGVINQWVEEKTKNKIKDLISPDMLDSLTRLVMVNAVYFKGNWQDQFKPEMTTTEPFYVSAEVKKDVRMMHLKKHFRYSEVDELEAQVLELPYEERQVSMVILLPNDRNGLPNLEAKLTSEKLTEVLSQLHSTEVNVSIPRFKLEDTIDLNSVLQEMGMNNMFEDSADFSGITDDAAGLKVSQVVQKAFIEVNEEGSEAAAATGMVMMTRMCLITMPETTFVADHPFMFALLGHPSQTILFYGKVGNP